MDIVSKTTKELQDEIILLKKRNNELEQRLTEEQNNHQHSAEKVKTSEIEDSMRESEAKFRQIFDFSPVGIVMVGLDKRFLQCNNAFAKSLGRTIDEIIGQTIEDLTYPDDRLLGMPEMLAILKGEIETSNVHKRYIRKDQEFIWADVSISLIRDGKGRPQYFLAIIQDITDRKKVEEKVIENEQKFKSIFENSPLGKSMTGIDGTLHVNKLFCDILGYSEKELKFKKWQELTHPDDIRESEEIIQSLIKGEKSRANYEKRYIHKNGNIVWTDVNTTLQRDKNNNPLYFITTINDITERKQMEQVLKDAEVKFRAIFDKASDGILLAETGSKTFYMANSKICEMLGYSPDEILNIGLGEIHLEKDMPYAIEQFERLARNEISVATNIPVMRKDRTVFYADISSGFLRLEGKDYLIGIFRDITERKLNEEKIKRFNDELEDSVIKRTAELKDAMELNLKVIETSPLGVFACREDGPCIIANPAVAKISGATVQQMLQLNFRNLDSWKENGLFEKVEIALHTKKEQQAVIHITSTFGKDLWIKYYITTFYSGDILHFLMIVEDVTQRKQAEIELGRKSEQLALLSNELEIIIDSIPGLVFYKDTNNRFIRVNKYICDSYKMSKKQLEGIHLNDLHTKEEAQAYYEADLEVIRSGKPKLNIDERWETESGIQWVSTSKIPYLNEKNEVIGIIGTSMDITDRKLAEEELQKHRDNLEELVKERTSDLEKTLQNLERSNKELEQFAYVASHDLQEPLRMVSSFTQLLEKRYANQLDNDAREFIGFAVDGANRMQKLINDLLDFSRITTRGKEFTKLDVSSVLANAIINLHEKIRETGAIVTNEELPFIKGDESQLIRLFQNLIDNAIKFRGELSPRIHISFQSLTDFWQISVKDNGIGINPEYSERVFQIFQRLNNNKKYPGTGIGLAVCKRIVERHNGKIWVESEEGHGSTFYFTLKK